MASLALVYPVVRYLEELLQDVPFSDRVSLLLRKRMHLLITDDVLAAVMTHPCTDISKLSREERNRAVAALKVLCPAADHAALNASISELIGGEGVFSKEARAV